MYEYFYLEDANEVEQDLTNDELAQYDPPSAKILKVLRIREIRRRQTIKLFTDLSVYVILLAMVMILSFQYRNPASYKMINTLRRVFVDPIHNSSYVRFDQVRVLFVTPRLGETTYRNFLQSFNSMSLAWSLFICSVALRLSYCTNLSYICLSHSPL